MAVPLLFTAITSYDPPRLVTPALLPCSMRTSIPSLSRRTTRGRLACSVRVHLGCALIGFATQLADSSSSDAALPPAHHHRRLPLPPVHLPAPPSPMRCRLNCLVVSGRFLFAARRALASASMFRADRWDADDNRAECMSTHPSLPDLHRLNFLRRLSPHLALQVPSRRCLTSRS